MSESKLKIVGLYADNYQNLNAVEIKFDPEGNVHFIKGDNGAGKTSIIEFIHWMFTGKKSIDDNSVQIGKEKMEGWVDVGEFKIERKFSPTSSGLKIIYPDGLTRERAKQEFLDTLANPSLTFNPFPFLNLNPEEKLKWMMNFLNIDFTEIDDKLSNLETERRFKGKALKEIGKIEDVEKVDYVDVSKLVEEKNDIQEGIEQELETIRSFNNTMTQRENALEMKGREIAGMEDRIEEIDEKIRRLKEENSVNLLDLSDRKKEFKELPVPEEMKEVETELNTDEIDRQIVAANDTNVQHERWLQSVEKQKAKDEKQQEYDSFTEGIKALRESKIKKLSEIKPGIEGFEIKENGLYWQGIAVDHLSDSESLEFSMQLCLSTNPRLNVFFVDRGESIGPDRMKVMKDFAKKHDIQLIITQVAGEIPDEKQKNTFYLVEGKIQE